MVKFGVVVSYAIATFFALLFISERLASIRIFCSGFFSAVVGMRINSIRMKTYLVVPSWYTDPSHHLSYNKVRKNANHTYLDAC